MDGLRKLSLVALIGMVPTLATAATPVASASVRAACTPDAKRLCGAVISDPEARRKCMIAHRAQLSEACKNAIAEDKKNPVSPEATDPSKTPAAPAAAPSNTK
jgi:hypothetical protein